MPNAEISPQRPNHKQAGELNAWNDDAFKGDYGDAITSTQLAKIKLRALRRRVWFRALSQLERAIVDLTIRTVKRIQSRVLAETVSRILAKLIEALQTNFVKHVLKIGREAARKMSQIAQKWGNKEAPNWADDPTYIWYLGVMEINKPRMLM